MKKKTIRTRTWDRAALLSLACLSATSTFAANLYWDLDGATPGPGFLDGGMWDTSLENWSLDPTGSSVTQAWSNSPGTDIAIFSAGDLGVAAGGYTVTLTGTGSSDPGAIAGGIVVKDGIVRFGGSAFGSNVTINDGDVTIGPGAELVMDHAARILATAGSSFSLLGGTLTSTNPGNAGSFFDSDSELILGPQGGTVQFTTADRMSIINPTSPVSGSGSLTKKGVGVIAIASAASYTGDTIIEDGELRVRSSNNRLPVSTAVTIITPGILNLNGLAQQIGSLSGNGDVGLGNGTLTIDGSTDTIFTGVIANIRNAGASGVTTGNGKVVKNGTGSITLDGLNSYTGSFTLNDGTVTVGPNGSLAGPTADVFVNGGVLNLNNPAQTIENLNGTGGTINLGPGHVLTSDPAGNATYSGTIAGPGSLVKANVLSGATNRTLTLSGNNTYLGTTTVSGGILSVGSATALGSPLAETIVASGAEVLFTGAATNFTIDEPFLIAGAGNNNNAAIAVIASASPTLAGPITLTGDATVTVSSTATAFFTNTTAFTAPGSATLTLQGGSGAGGGGTITGAIDLGTGGLTKLQGGTWTIAGDANIFGATTIGAGTLLVNGGIAGPSAVTVSGTLGGSGAITPSLNADITFTATGKLAPGASAGTLSFALGGDGTLDLTGAIDASTGALLFELGAENASDKVAITGGPLTIGSGLLGLEDFNFTFLAGFEGGDYLLFDGDTAIAGTLGPGAIGLANGLPAELQLADDGKDIILHIVPEPGTGAILLAGLGVLMARRRMGRQD